MRFKKLWSLLATLLLATPLSVVIAESSSPGTPGEFAGDPYTLDICVVSNERLGSMGDPVVMVRDGREIRFCCAACVPAFDKEPEAHLTKMDEAMKAQQRPHYPLETCPISGQALGSMGEPAEIVHGNRLVRLCCAGCAPSFQSDSAEHLRALDQAVIDRQKDDYALETCVVSNQPLGSMGEPYDHVVANRLVRFCCAGCLSAFHEDPAKHLAILDGRPWAAEEHQHEPEPEQKHHCHCH